MTNASQVVAIVTGILGAMLGSAGLAVSILNYLRDRPKLKVTLQWNMTALETRAILGIVWVTNVGRRPTHLGAVALVLPPKYKDSHLTLHDSIKGTRLEEGGKPAVSIVNYDNMAQYKADWHKIRAMAEDSTGKAYFSEYPKVRPSWAS
jgi:hypothetical protein